MKIKLTKGYCAIIDSSSYHLIKNHSWYTSIGNYAYSRINRKLIPMHRLIINAKPGEFVDHINGNTLDNRKRNLRICTKSENGFNRTKTRQNSSGYKGVYRHAKNWRARIKVNYKLINLGTYKTKLEAAHAYNIAAIKYHGKFANINKL